MLAMLKDLTKRTPLIRPLIYAKSLFTRPTTQNDEAIILRRLLARHDVPKRFVEFGFSGWEFNCAGLVDEWEGLLIDGDEYNVTIARTILPKRVRAVRLWITLETLDLVREFVAKRPLGILSIDVDGNDYWFLEALIDLKPAIIISEYNSSFGRIPVTVPYDPEFDRRKKHPEWIYYGASLAALTFLAEARGYRLIDVAGNGINAFFLRSDLLSSADVPLQADCAFRDQVFPNGSLASDQWPKIAGMDYVDVTTL
jgi:hypothetical protein